MFDIVNMEYPYTAIFGRGFTNKFEVVIKQSYLCMKMHSPFDIITIHGDQLASRRIEGKPIPGYSLINEVIKKPEETEQGCEKTISPRAETRDDTQRTPLIEAVPDKCVHISTNLSAQEKQVLLSFLHENNDVFAWLAKDLQGIGRNLTQHNLNVTKGSIPRKQKLRKMSTKRAEAVKAEVQRLLDVSVIRLV